MEGFSRAMANNPSSDNLSQIKWGVHRAAKCTNESVAGHIYLPLTFSGPMLPIPKTVAGLCVTTPKTGPELTERISFCIIKNYSLYECFHLLSWKNNLGSNIMYQDKNLLDIESESFQNICMFPDHSLKQSSCYVHSHPWNKEIRREFKY